MSAPADLLAIGEAARPLLVEHAQLSVRLRTIELENRLLLNEVGDARQRSGSCERPARL